MNRPRFRIIGATWALSGVALHESHADTATVTDHPVEQGGGVTDFVRDEVGALEVLVAFAGLRSSRPLISRPFSRPQYPPPALSAGAVTTGLIAAVGNKAVPSSLRVIAPDPDDDPFLTAYQRLLATKTAGEQVDVVTGIRYYPGVVITGIRVERTGEPGEEISLSFRPVRSVAFQSIDLPAPVVEPQLARPTGLGTQSPGPAGSKPKGVDDRGLNIKGGK